MCFLIHTVPRIQSWLNKKPSSCHSLPPSAGSWLGPHIIAPCHGVLTVIPGIHTGFSARGGGDRGQGGVGSNCRVAFFRKRL